ncbi:MAG: c-type cytochrome [Nitrospinae bacterium]|nr:c-type cytochrome [Nitrospinota bacterium]
MKKYVLALAMSFAFVGALAGYAAAAGDAGKGEGLFTGKGQCKNCHKLDEKAQVGPGLKGVTTRHADAWLTTWLGDPQKTWEGNDADVQKLKTWKPGRDKAPKTAMKIPHLDDAEIADLIAFLHKNDGK